MVSVLIVGGAIALLGRPRDRPARPTISRPSAPALIGGADRARRALARDHRPSSSALLQGVIVGEVARETLGEKLTFRALWQLVKGRIGALIGWTLLFALAWIVAARARRRGRRRAGRRSAARPGPSAAVVVGIVGGLGLIALAVWINTKLVMVPERDRARAAAARAAVARSWRLTTRLLLATFGIIALVGVIVYAITQIDHHPRSASSAASSAASSRRPRRDRRRDDDVAGARRPS